MPGIYKLRYVGNATLGSAAVRTLPLCQGIAVLQAQTLACRSLACSWLQGPSCIVGGVKGTDSASETAHRKSPQGL